jgi:RHS repeat-associated protein
MRVVLWLAFASAALLPASGAEAAPTERYIIKKDLLFRQPDATASLAIDVTNRGGRVDLDWLDRMIVSLPAEAAEHITRSKAVKYLQRVITANQAGVPQPVRAASLAAPTVVTTSIPPWDSGPYAYDGSGNITAIGSETFTYDALSRLKSANVRGGSETYDYDRYGNLVAKTTTRAGSTVALAFPVAAEANNRLANHTYDDAGNLVAAPSGPSHEFDAANMMVRKQTPWSATPEYYLYTAADERVAVIAGCTGPGACANALVTLSFRDEGGRVLRQFDVPYPYFSTSPWHWVEDYVYRGSQLVAAERPAAVGGQRHLHLDHLGTPRLITRAGGAKIAEHDYFPFGAEATPLAQEIAAGYERDDPLRFTGHERDLNAGVIPDNQNYYDYMHARMYVPQWGRFLSVDPILGNPSQPQSWNRYAYVMNNPTNATDPTGRCEQQPGEPPCTDMTVTVEADAQNYAAIDTAADFVDLIAMQAAAPMLNVLAGLRNDDPGQIAVGYGQQLAMAVPGGVIAGTTGRLGTTSSSTLAVNLGGTGEVAGNVVNVQAASMGGDTGLALRSAVGIARSSGQRVVMAHGDALPFQTGAVRTVITNNVPVDAGVGYFGRSFTTAEIIRILQPFGRWIGSSAP